MTEKNLLNVKAVLYVTVLRQKARKLQKSIYKLCIKYYLKACGFLIYNNDDNYPLYLYDNC